MSIDRRRRRALSLALFLCLLSAAWGAAARAERLPVREFTSADGLGSSFINYLMRDSRGFLWFCTRDGLSRFDGSRFITYRVGDKNSSPNIEYILETHDGIYWITTSAGLYRFDPNATPANQSPKAGRPTINALSVGDNRGGLYEDRAGNLWAIGSTLSRLEYKDGKVTAREVPLNLPPDPSVKFDISSICEGRDGSLWLGATTGLIRRLPDGREVFYTVETPSSTVASVIEDESGRIWFGRESGVYIINPESLADLAPGGTLTIRRLNDAARTPPQGSVSLPEKAGEIVRYIDIEGSTPSYFKLLYQTSDHHIWISGGDGVVEFDGQRFIPHTMAQGLLKGTGHMVEDASSNLWLGWSTGLMRLDRHGITTYDSSDGLNTSQITTIGEGRDGKLFVMGAKYSLSRFDGRRFQTARPQLPPDATEVWSSNTAFQDHTGEWWFLSLGGLYHFAATDDVNILARERPLAVYSEGGGFKGSFMFHIFEDSKGNLWVSARGATQAQNSLSRWDRAEKRFYILSAADGFPSDKAVYSFAEDSSGDLWLGFYEGGMARYGHGRFTEYTPADGLPDGVITSLHFDEQGRLWVASSEDGLSRVDDVNADRLHFVNYNLDSGLSSNNVRSLTEDLYGNIYAGTARGIDRISPNATRIQHYTIKEGLAGDFVNVAFRDRTGALWFGTQNGVSRLVPDIEAAPSPPPSVWLGGLRIAGEGQALPELGVAEAPALEFSHTQNNLQIDFFGVDFNAGETLRYQFMLEGADTDWGAPTEQESVNYSNLAPGSYRFLVRAVNAYGMTSARPASFSFRILPPFWRRWWFLALAVLAVSLTVFALDRYRVNRVRELDAALTEAKLLTGRLTEQRSELRKANRVLELEYEVTNILAEAATPGEAAPKILEEICKTIDWHAGVIWNVDKESGRLRCQDVWPTRSIDDPEFNAGTIQHTFARGEGLPGRVWTTGAAQWVTELSDEADDKSISDYRIIAEMAQKELKSAFGFPITLEGEVIGVLEFFNSERCERDPELLEIMSSVGGDIGQLIERRRADEALRQVREERLRELERVRTRIATDLHDDIGSSLTQIVILSEVARQQLNGHDEKLAEPLTEITTVSNELVEAMSDIVWAINPKKDHLSDLVQRMRRFASDIFSSCQINFSLHAQQADRDIQLGANVRRELFLIFKESVNNTVKHAGCTEAEAEFYRDEDSLILKLSDNGRGFDVSAALAEAGYSKGGNGLASMKRRAEDLGGSYEIASSPGEGTMTTLKVPLGQTPGA